MSNETSKTETSSDSEFKEVQKTVNDANKKPEPDLKKVVVAEVLDI